MNKKRNAFTLIELLAIIVILAIIAVITVPIILNIIENSKKGAITDSAYGYKDAVNKAYVTELSKPNKEGLKLNGIYEVQSDGTLVPADGYSFGITNYNTLPVSLSGDKPTSGSLTYENNVLTSGCLTIGDYKVTFESGSVNQTVKGNCDDYVISGGSEQGGSEGGNNQNNGNNEETPITNPYETTFDGEYSYKALGTGDSLIEAFDSSWMYYIRQGTKKEVCGVFNGGTACLEYDGWESNITCTYDPEQEIEEDIYLANCISEGYVAGKKLEMESKGATCQYEYYTYNPSELHYGLYCYYDNNYCTIDGRGHITCGILGEGYCSISGTSSRYMKCSAD